MNDAQNPSSETPSSTTEKVVVNGVRLNRYRGSYRPKNWSPQAEEIYQDALRVAKEYQHLVIKPGKGNAKA